MGFRTSAIPPYLRDQMVTASVWTGAPLQRRTQAAGRQLPRHGRAQSKTWAVPCPRPLPHHRPFHRHGKQATYEQRTPDYPRSSLPQTSHHHLGRSSKSPSYSSRRHPFSKRQEHGAGLHRVNGRSCSSPTAASSRLLSWPPARSDASNPQEGITALPRPHCQVE